jgi:hypothetical protein
MRAGAWPELVLAGISVISVIAGVLVGYRRRTPEGPAAGLATGAAAGGPDTVDARAGAGPAHEHT